MFLTQILLFIYMFVSFYNVDTRKKSQKNIDSLAITYNVDTRKKSQKIILIHLQLLTMLIQQKNHKKNHRFTCSNPMITDHQPTITKQFSSHNEHCLYSIICLTKMYIDWFN